MTEKDSAAPVTLLKMLADGQMHSGSELAATLGVSRAAVWKRIAKLAELGVQVHTTRSQGYRLAEPLELLDDNLISRNVAEQLQRTPPTIEVVQHVDSTNTVLLKRARASHSEGISFLLAEQQTEGRGRRGRAWLSPFARNIYMSALWGTERSLQGLDGLSLAVGVVVATTLRTVFSVPAALKWPNDVLVGNAKIGGILIEVDGDLAGPLSVVIGIGLNVDMPLNQLEAIDQPWTDIVRQRGAGVSRNEVASSLIARLTGALEQFERLGFAPFRDEWTTLDAFAGRDVRITGLPESCGGIERGVDEKGALLIEVDGAIRAFVAGDVSLRAVS